jgi:hypothetical protein
LKNQVLKTKDSERNVKNKSPEKPKMKKELERTRRTRLLGGNSTPAVLAPPFWGRWSGRQGGERS